MRKRFERAILGVLMSAVAFLVEGLTDKKRNQVVGELENISPGLTRDFTVELSDAGTYQTACKPGMKGKGIRADFTVTG